MHPRNPFQDKNFKSPIKFDLPSGHLAPRLASRLDYILWIEELVTNAGIKKSLRILDFGCGPVAIYCLLGSWWRPDWLFTGIEKEIESFKVAMTHANVLHSDHIVTEFDVLMCNPPFYESRKEMQNRAAFKKPKLSTETMTDGECLTPGGELAFIRGLIEESKGHPHAIFTFLLGIKSNMEVLRKELGDFCATAFIQAGRTRRWIIAWSQDKKLSFALNGASRLGYQRLPTPFIGSLVIKDSFWCRTARRGKQAKQLANPLKVTFYEDFVKLVEGTWNDFLSYCEHLRKAPCQRGKLDWGDR